MDEDAAHRGAPRSRTTPSSTSRSDPHARRVRRTGTGQGAARAPDRRGAPARRARRPPAVQRAPRDSGRPRSARSSPTRWASGFQPTSGPALDRAGRPGRDPHEPRRRRRAVRRRDPSHAADGRGGPVSGARGLQARRRARQGADGPEHPAGAAAVHAGRRRRPVPGASRCRCASGSGSRRAWTTTRSTTSGRIVRRSAGILGGPDRRRRRGRDRRALARHPAHREPTAPSRPRLRRGSPRRRHHRGARACRARAVRGRRAGSGQARPHVLATVVEKFGGGPVGLSTLAAAVGEEPDTIEDVVRALPDAARLPEADAARPRRDRASVPPPGCRYARNAAPLAAASHRFCRSEGRLRGRIDPDRRHPYGHTKGSDGMMALIAAASTEQQQPAHPLPPARAHGRGFLLPPDQAAAEARPRPGRPWSTRSRSGDEIMTTGGIFGTVVELDDDEGTVPSRSRPAPRSGW